MESRTSAFSLLNPPAFASVASIHNAAEIHSPAAFLRLQIREIRNPLTNISLASEVLQQVIVDDAQKMYLEIIVRNSDRIHKMVETLLSIEDSSQSVLGVLKEALKETNEAFNLENVKITERFATDCRLHCNPQQLKLAFLNILSNAIEAMPADKGSLEITGRSLQHAYILMIKDNGYGINTKDFGKIFNPYYSSKSNARGLDLSATKAILDSHQIGIHIRSRTGQGTRVMLLFKSGKG